MHTYSYTSASSSPNRCALLQPNCTHGLHDGRKQPGDSRLCVGSGKLSPPALAILALAPNAIVRTDARAPAVLAGAPDAVMLADARAPAVLAPLPLSVMLADARAPAVLA